MKKTEITEKMPIFPEGTYIFYHIEFIDKLHWHSQHFWKEKVTSQEGWILLWGTI
jgi:hypothetical protein